MIGRGHVHPLAWFLFLAHSAVAAAQVNGPSPSHVREAGKVSVNGLSFAYVDEGSGPPVVLVHGSVSDYREWSRQMVPLAQHYRVIVDELVAPQLTVTYAFGPPSAS